MDEETKAFTRGFACCLANAIRLEDYRPSQIAGGITLDLFRKAGVDESDLKVIKEGWNK